MVDCNVKDSITEKIESISFKNIKISQGGDKLKIKLSEGKMYRANLDLISE